MKRAVENIITGFILAVLLTAVSCSSKPKNSGDIYDMRVRTEKELVVGNREAGRGNFEIALGVIKECKRKAILVDDTWLIIRSALSLGNALFTVGRRDEAFVEWEEALALAERQENKEYLSVARVYYARGRLLSGKTGAGQVLEEVNRESVNIKSDKLFVAFSWQVKGLAQRELRSYREAEEAVKRSLEIHEKEKYLENASYDWYIIASIRSLAGNFPDALHALESSIALDRRTENPWGLAANWSAMGDVYRKAGKTREAMEAYRRARAIYEAMKYDKEVSEIDKKMQN